MKLNLLFGCLLASSLTAPVFGQAAAEPENNAPDSVRITNNLEVAKILPATQNKLMFLAKTFLGTPYKAATLETYPNEHLVVRTDAVDCTTFVENAVALYKAYRSLEAQAASAGGASVKVEQTPYAAFKKALQQIRYRDGKIEGYSSRLHYFSDWIADNQRKGLVREVTKESPNAVRKLDLNFMTTHASLYPYLKNDANEVARMKKVESRWIGYEMPYIPKEKLNLGPDVLKIKDGDIIALVTNMEGLDLVHVGFANWVDGKLHLLNASSLANYVLVDQNSLYDYLIKRKSHLGIRVIRVLD